MKRIYCFLLIFICSNYLIGQKNADVVLTIGHTDQINSLDINPKGTYIVSGGNDNLVKVWDISTTKELRTYTGNDGRVEFVKFTPDGNYVSALNYQDKLNVWNLATGVMVATFDATSSVGTFDFALEGKYIVFCDEENNIVLADFITGEIFKKINVTGIIRFKVHPSGKKLYYLDYKGFLKGINLETGEEISSLQVNPEFQFPFTRFDIDATGKYLAADYVDDKIHIYDLDQNKEVHVFSGHTSHLTDLQFEKTGSRLITSDHNKQIFVWDVENKKELFHRESSLFGVKAMAFHPTEKLFVYSEMNKIHYVTIEEGEEKKLFASKANSVVSMDYSQNGKYLASSTTEVTVKLWDISKNKLDKTLMGFFPVQFSPNGENLVCMGTPMALYVYNPTTGEKIRELNTEYDLQQSISFSRDGKWVAGTSYTGVIRIWNLESGKLEKKMTGHLGGIYNTSFHPDGKILASAGLDQTIKIWDLKTGKEIKTISGHEVLVSDVEFSSNGKWLASSSWDKKIFIWNTSSWEMEKTLEGHVNSIMAVDFSSDDKYLVSCAGNNTVSIADNSIRVWELATGKMVCKFDNPTGQINNVEFEDNGNLIFSSGNDGFIKIWDFTKCSEVVSLASIGKSDYVITTPDFYYTASKDALSAISFRIGTNLFPFEQFDIKLNRPDIIAERIGKTPPNLMNAYKYVHEKRLKKMNYKEEDLGKEFHLPVTVVKKDNIPLVQTDSFLKFSVRLEDDQFKIDHLLIYLNGVPVYGRAGLDLRDLKSGSIEYEVKMLLMDGNNHIQVSCMNEKGAESLIDDFAVVKENKNEKHDLYFVSIGVSKYKQSDFNLNYAAKDAQDMVNKLTQAQGMYSKVNQLIFVDEEVTKEKIQLIKEFIAPAGINDVVILFFAGHGVLDENFDYFFATHDIDFNEPKERGIAYFEIESLLDAVKAIRKLLLMDTCHSGELDKEEIKSTSAAVSIKEVKFRSVGNAVKLNDPFGVGNSQELMGLLFTDLKKGSGATVISSSSGAEFSMESDQYKNGLFTYCLLNSFSDWNTDKNLDQKITVSEWSGMAFENVVRMSGGLQKPNTRTVNLNMDFRIW